MVITIMKRDIQGKFALKNDDYRKVRSLRLIDETWLALGIAAECLGITRADYLEQIVRDNTLPSITWEDYSQEKVLVMEQAVTALPQMADLEALRDRILLDLKLGKQAPGYKAAQKALNRFIAELASPA